MKNLTKSEKIRAFARKTKKKNIKRTVFPMMKLSQRTPTTTLTKTENKK